MPTDADNACRILEDVNRRFSRRMESGHTGTASEGEPRYVVACNGLQFGMPRTNGEMPQQMPCAVVIGCSGARNAKWEIEVFYGVLNIRTLQVCSPVDPTAPRSYENVRLAHAPTNRMEFHTLGVQ